MNENNIELNPPRRVDTPDLVLRVSSADDVTRLQQTLEQSDAHLRAWTPWVIDGRVPGLSLEERILIDAEAFASGDRWVYGIFTPGEEELIGGCGMYPRVGPRAVEIGYWVAAAHTRRGVATKATAELTRLAFSNRGIDHIDIRCEPGNVVSARVASRLRYCLIADEAGGSGKPDEPANATPLRTWRLTRAELETAEF